MKYLLTFCLLCFGSAGALRAQMAIKPTVGINFTNFSKNPDGSYKAQVGYQVGGTLAFGKKLYIEPGVFYMQKSTQYTESVTNDQITFNLSGIRVPLTVGINLLGNTKSFIGLRALGGVSAFFLTNTQELNKDEFNSVNWGLYAGAGFDISIVFLEVHYEWSLTNVQKDVSAIDIGQTRTLYINAGIRIPL